MYRSGLPAACRHIRGLLWALVLVLAFAGGARADDCSALNGGSFSFTGGTAGDLNPFGVFHNNGQEFTVDAGKTLTFTVTVPAESALVILFGGETITVDNTGNGAPVTKTVSFTVAEGSGSVTGTMRFEGFVDGTETLTIDIACSGATTPSPDPDPDPDPDTGSSSGGEMGGLMDSLVQSVVPGPGLLDTFSVPPLEPLDCEDAAERYFELRARIRDVLAAADHDLAGSDSDLAPLRAEENALAECLEALLQRVVERFQPLDPTEDDPCAAEKKLSDAMNEELDRTSGNLGGAGGTIPGSAKNIAIAESDAGVAFMRLMLCRESNLQGYFPTPRTGASAAALDRLVKDPVHGSFGALGYQPGSPVAITGSANSFAFAYDLSQDRQRIERAFGAPALPVGLLGDPRFNLWLKGNVIFHIDPTGVLQRGTTAAVAGGASYRFLPWLNAGVAARYAHSNRFGGAGNGSADAWSVATFAQARVARRMLLEAIVAYSGVSANATFASGATGFATGRSLAGQAKLSRSFDLGSWQVTPALGLSVVNVQRDAFTASDGTVVGASNSTQTTLTFGPTFRPQQAYPLGDGAVSVRPEFGVDLFANLGRFDPLIGTGGAAVSSDTFGVTARTGLGFAFAGGASASINAAYAGIGGTSQAVSVSANVRVPIGGR